MKKALSLAIALFAVTMARATVATNTWTGASTTDSSNWGQPDNWSPATTPSLGNTDQYGAYFDKTEDTTISVGYNNLSAIDVVIGSGAGAFTFTRPNDTTKLTLRHNGSSYPSFLNLSGKTATFNIPIDFAYGGNDVSISGGAIFNNTLSETGNGTFYFLAQNPSTDEAMRTTGIGGTATFKKANIATNHIVDVMGTLTAAADLRIRGSLVVENGGVVDSPIVGVEYTVGHATFKDGSTVRTASLGPANTSYRTGMTAVNINGVVTLDTTGYTETTNGTKLVFADGAKLLLTGGGKVLFDEGSPAIGKVAIAGNVELAAWPVADGQKMELVADTGLELGSAATEVLMLTVPVSVKEVTVDDFAIAGSFGLDKYLTEFVTVRVDTENDVQKVYAERPAWVWRTKTGSNVFWESAEMWSDSAAAGEGKDYIFSAKGRSDSQNTSTAVQTFPGDSVTIVATNGSQVSSTSLESYIAFLALKGQTNVINDLTLGAFGGVTFQNWNGAGASNGQSLQGSIKIVASTTNAPAYIAGSSNRPNRLDSKLSGDGQLRFVANDSTMFNVTLNGDNSGYIGSLRIDGTQGGGATVKFSSAANLGGNPASALSDGLRINNATLELTDAAATEVTLNQSNRYIRFMRESTITVASGKTLKIASPIEYDTTAMPTITKSGAGTLILSGEVKMANANTTWNVAEGNLVIGNPYAGKSVKSVNVADGAHAYLPSLSVTAAEESAKKFAAKEWLFVPDGDANKTPVENLALMRARGWTEPDNYGLASRWATTLSQVAVDGGVMLKVSGRVRGFVIIIH